jgi:serine/threonine-protein kinase SRPK3
MLLSRNLNSKVAAETVFDESLTTKLKDDGGDSDNLGTFVCDEEPHMLAPELGYGYYPLTLGERMCEEKYEIVRKLGWGQNSSVWLASVCK